VKTTQELRLEKLRNLRSQFRFQNELAELIKKDPAHVHQWLAGKKTIGHRSAREIETALGKPAGWLDNDHSIGCSEGMLPLPTHGKPRGVSAPLAPDEAELLRCFRRCSPEVKAVVLATVRTGAYQARKAKG